LVVTPFGIGRVTLAAQARSGSLRRVRRRPAAEQLQAWIVTGPIGHLWSAMADIALIWARYLMNRARGRV
jgi:hypothetical protein